MIFLYIQPNEYERLRLRRLCNMFKASLKAPPKGKWTEYPHSNHTSIDSLMDRCYELYEEDPMTAPTIFFIKGGEHDLMTSVRQRSTNHLPDERPTGTENRKAARGMGNGKSGGAAEMPA